MSPRPILKRSAVSCQTNNHPPERYAVHFPPSPSLSRTFTAHSPSAYDRSPIVVAPNTCALPERGCPGRTYALEEPRSSTVCLSTSAAPATARGHAHPRGLEARYSQQAYGCSVDALPPLIPDLSSESDESDGFTSPPPESYGASSRSYSSPKYPSSYTSYDSFNHSIQSPSYGSGAYHIPPSSNGYPYIPSSPSLPYPRSYADPVSPSMTSPPKTRHRHRSSSSTSPPPSASSSHYGDVAADDPGYDDDRDIDTPSCSPSSSHLVDRERKKGKRSLSKALSAFKLQDEDSTCLGGF